MLLILLVVFSIIPTVLPTVFIDSYFTDGIVLFLVGGFLRNNRDVIWNKCSSWLLIGAAMLIWLGAGTFSVVFSEKQTLYSFVFLYERNSPVTILVAAVLFVAFGQWEMKSHFLVNQMAKHVFAVFLIHDNLFFSPVMWHTWFDNSGLWDSGWIVFHMLFAVGVIFVVCVLIDILRKIILEDVLLEKCRKVFH